MDKLKRRKTRHFKIRKKVYGQSLWPRLTIFRSNRYIWAQIIDDEAGKTLTAESDKKIKSGTKIEKAKETGTNLAKKAIKKEIKKVVFDRSGYKYHGRVKALADGAREGGLSF